MEAQIKSLFLAGLIKKNPNLLFASIEVPIIGGKRKIDILSVEKNNIVGYEIKSAKDNLTKLEGQIQDYLKICDRVYVILDKKFSNSTLNLPQNVGIYFFDMDKKSFFLKRRAKKNTPLAYYQSLFIAKRTLGQYKQKSNQTPFEIRHYIIKKLNKTDFKRVILNELNNRFMENFLLLKNEFVRNLNTIHPDDLFLLFGEACIKEKK